MKKSSHFLVSFVCLNVFALAAFGQNVKSLATNTRWEVVGDNVIFFYDLPNDLSQNLFVKLILKRYGDPAFRVLPRTVQGDIGRGNFNGADKQIVWSYLVDQPNGLTGDDYYFILEVMPYKLGDETFEERLLPVTLYTGQNITILCPHASGGFLVVEEGPVTLTQEYSEVLKGDEFVANDQQEPIKSCNQLNDALRGDFIVLRRNGKLITYKLPGIKSAEKAAAKLAEERALAIKKEQEEILKRAEEAAVEARKKQEEADRKAYVAPWFASLSYGEQLLPQLNFKGPRLRLLIPMRNGKKDLHSYFTIGAEISFLKGTKEPENSDPFTFVDYSERWQLQPSSIIMKGYNIQAILGYRVGWAAIGSDLNFRLSTTLISKLDWELTQKIQYSSYSVNDYFYDPVFLESVIYKGNYPELGTLGVGLRKKLSDRYPNIGILFEFSVSGINPNKLNSGNESIHYSGVSNKNYNNQDEFNKALYNEYFHYLVRNPWQPSDDQKDQNRSGIILWVPTITIGLTF